MSSLLLLLSITSAHALQPGPYDVSTRTYNFTDANYDQGFVKAKLYYPAVGTGNGADVDLTGGPYPLTAFVHGWLGNVSMYDEVCTQIASLGFVVASINTETGLFLDMNTLALDTAAMLQKVEDDSNGSTWLTGAVSSTVPWSAMGHSMGGATLGRLVGLEPRIETYVAFMPYEGEAAYYTNVSNFTGAYLVITADEDTTAPTALGREWFEGTTSASRSLYFGIEGAGHQAVTDFVLGDETMGDDRQREIVAELAGDFLTAEVLGDEGRYELLTGPEAARFPTIVQSLGQDPALWATVFEGNIDLGVTAGPDDTVTLYLGTGPGSTLTDAGTAPLANATILDQDLLTVDGVLNLEQAVPADWASDLWIVAQINGDTDSRAILLSEGEAVPEEPTVPGTDPGPDPTTVTTATTNPASAPQDKGGCSTSPLPLGWMPLLLVFGFVRRSRAICG